MQRFILAPEHCPFWALVPSCPTANWDLTHLVLSLGLWATGCIFSSLSLLCQLLSHWKQELKYEWWIWLLNIELFNGCAVFQGPVEGVEEMTGWERHALPPFLLCLLSFLPFLLPPLFLSSSIGSYCFLKYLLFIFGNYMHVYSVVLMHPHTYTVGTDCIKRSAWSCMATNLLTAPRNPSRHHFPFSKCVLGPGWGQAARPKLVHNWLTLESSSHISPCQHTGRRV